MAMLNTLKSLVYQKNIFAEQAKMILDDDDNFDRLILMEAEEQDPELPEGSKDPLENDNSKVQPEGENPMPIDTENDASDNTETDQDIMSMDIDSTTDTIRNVVPSPPAGAGDQIDDSDLEDSPNGGNVMDEEISDNQSETGEEKVDLDKDEEKDEDLMNEEIPMEKDTDESSDMDQNNSSSEEKDIMDEDISEVNTDDTSESEEDEDTTENSAEEMSQDDEDKMLEAAGIRIIDTDIFNEAITLDGTEPAPQNNAQPAAANQPQQNTPPDPQVASAAPDANLAPEGDNPVTAAVKEKVSETNDQSTVEPSTTDSLDTGMGDGLDTTPPAPEAGLGTPPTDDSGSDAFANTTPIANKDEVVKKTSNLAKNAIDLLTDIQSQK